MCYSDAGFLDVERFSDEISLISSSSALSFSVMYVASSCPLLRAGILASRLPSPLSSDDVSFSSSSNASWRERVMGLDWSFMVSFVILF